MIDSTACKMNACKKLSETVIGSKANVYKEKCDKKGLNRI